MLQNGQVAVRNSVCHMSSLESLHLRLLAWDISPTADTTDSYCQAHLHEGDWVQEQGAAVRQHHLHVLLNGGEAPALHPLQEVAHLPPPYICLMTGIPGFSS